MQRTIRSLQTLSGMLMVLSMMAVPAVVSAASSPIGSLDGAVGAEMIQGWACDADNFNQPLTIHLYNGPAKNANPISLNIVADQAREAAIGTHCGGNSNHAFYFTIPNSLKDGQAHQIYGYAVNIGGGANTHLSNSPITIQYGPGAAALSIEQTVDRTTVEAGEFITYSVNVKNTGVGTAPGIQVLDNVPAGLTFVTAGSTAGCTQQGGQVSCPAYNYVPGDNRTFVLKFQVAANAACNAVIEKMSDLWGVNGQLGGPLAWSNGSRTTVICPITIATPTPTPVITTVISNNNSTGAVTNNNELKNGDNKIEIRTGDQKVIVQTAPAPKVAAAVYPAPVKPVSVPVTAKTGGELYSLLSILLGGSGLAITRRFLA